MQLLVDSWMCSIYYKCAVRDAWDARQDVVAFLADPPTRPAAARGRQTLHGIFGPTRLLYTLVMYCFWRLESHLIFYECCYCWRAALCIYL